MRRARCSRRMAGGGGNTRGVFSAGWMKSGPSVFLKGVGQCDKGRIEVSKKMYEEIGVKVFDA